MYFIDKRILEFFFLLSVWIQHPWGILWLFPCLFLCFSCACNLLKVSHMVGVTALGNGCCRGSLGYWAVPQNVIVIFPWLWSFLCRGVGGMSGLFLPVVVGSAVCTFQRLVFAEVRNALMQSGDEENDKVLFPLDSKACWRNCCSGYSFLSPWLWQPFVDNSPFLFSSQVYTLLCHSSVIPLPSLVWEICFYPRLFQ